MTRLIYDGSFEGLLTAIFEIYAHKLTRVTLQRQGDANAAMFEDVIAVITDNIRATRVLKGLQGKLSPAGIQRLYIAHLANVEHGDNAVAGYIKYAFDEKRNIEDDFGNKYVQRVSEIVSMMRREKHRMEAFVRFKKLKDETYYAAIEPDFDVIPLLIKHFKNRYADQRWLIYDMKRRYGIFYNLHDVEFISLEFSEEMGGDMVLFWEDETIYQHLWKNYFNSANIPSRKNTRLHLRHIPKRYWKHLTEKI
jgi:probable DNA metabolism protein